MNSEELQGYEVFRQSVPGGVVTARRRRDAVSGWVGWVMLEAGGLRLRSGDFWAKEEAEVIRQIDEQAETLARALNPAAEARRWRLENEDWP